MSYFLVVEHANHVLRTILVHEHHLRYDRGMRAHEPAVEHLSADR